MTIHFYLNTQEETPITSLYDMTSNPFKLNDIVHLDVEELYPADYNKHNENFRNIMIKDNTELEKLFNRKKVKLVKEGMYMKFKVANKPKLTIEYHCDFVDRSLSLTLSKEEKYINELQEGLKATPYPDSYPDSI